MTIEEKLASDILYWSQHYTNYQKRIKKALDEEEAQSLAKLLLQYYEIDFPPNPIDFCCWLPYDDDMAAIDCNPIA